MIQNYSCSISKETLSGQFPGRKLSSHYRVSYNVNPGQSGWLITGEDKGRVVPAHWGLPDAGDPKGEAVTLFMAEGSRIATSSTFRMSLRQRRCIVLADSYYIWRKRGDKNQVFRVYSRDFPCLLLGGIYERRQIKGRDVICFTIVQTEAGADVKDIYHKMPLILDNDQAEQWIADQANIRDILEMIRPFKRYSLQYYQVTSQLMQRSFNQSEAHSRKLEHLTLFDV